MSPPPLRESTLGDITLSVVIPAYNYANTLERAVHSVTQQLASHHELIVIDDGSTDDTPAIMDRLAQEGLNNTRFIRQNNGGAASARNRGIVEAQGAWLLFLDADDELIPEALGHLDDHISLHPSTRMIIGGHTSVFPNGKTKQHLPAPLPADPLEKLRAYLLDKQIVLCNGACAMHKEIFTLGNYPESFRSAEDIPVFAQALANVPCTILPCALARIFKHDDSLRHQFSHAKSGGTRLVDEIFSTNRLPAHFHALKNAYFVQRCLSLFRSAYLAEDWEAAKHFFRQALQRDKKTLLKIAYLRKAARLWIQH